MHCPTPSVLVDTRNGKITPVPCNQWKCKQCAYRKGLKISNLFSQAAQTEREDVRMLTLTIAEDKSKLYATEQFNRFKTRMQQLGYMRKYFWCKEFQKRGARHFHVAVHEYIPKSVIDKHWGIGFTFINRIDKKRVRYVAKYLKKGMINTMSIGRGVMAVAETIYLSSTVNPIRFSFTIHIINGRKHGVNMRMI